MTVKKVKDGDNITPIAPAMIDPEAVKSEPVVENDVKETKKPVVKAKDFIDLSIVIGDAKEVSDLKGVLDKIAVKDRKTAQLAIVLKMDSIVDANLAKRDKNKSANVYIHAPRSTQQVAK